MNENDLFIIIKALLWYNTQVIQMPSNEEIMKFIKAHKEVKDETTKEPTLEDVIREWEENNFTVKIEKGVMNIINEENENEITIDIKGKEYWLDSWTNLKTHQLLNKTFQALGWFDE